MSKPSLNPTGVERTYHLTAGSGVTDASAKEFVAVALEFGFKRSRLLKAGVSLLPDSVRSVTIQVSAQRLIASFDPPLPKGTSVALYTVADGEPLERVVQETWYPRKTPLKGIVQFNWNQKLFRSSFLQRLKFLEELTSPKKEFCLHFTKLDCQSYPTLIGDKEYYEHFGTPADTADLRSKDLKLVTRTLISRLKNRRQQAETVPLDPPDDDFLRAVWRLSDLQIGLLKSSFPPPSGSTALIDIHSVVGAAEAHRWFATGRLHVDSGNPINNEPDSANVFLFAEFAALALELEGDLRTKLAAWTDTLHDNVPEDPGQRVQGWNEAVQIWGLLFRHLLSMQPVFLNAYKPTGTGRHFSCRDTGGRIEFETGRNTSANVAALIQPYQNAPDSQLRTLAAKNADDLCGDDHP